MAQTLTSPDDSTYGARFEANPEFLSASIRLSTAETAAPVIVIGMPRSGSTFLAHVLNCLQEIFVFDDLYFVQRAKALRCEGPLTAAQLDALVDFLGWQTRARIRHGTRFEQWPMTWNDVDTLCATVKQLFRGSRVTWPELMNEYLTRVAGFLGRKRWGYKTPQDFFHMTELSELFPRARFIFVLRDPRRMMASYKFNHTQDGRPGQYHPWAYARYWKVAITQARRSACAAHVLMLEVRLEDLMSNPEAAARRIGEFLGTELVHPISRSAPNSSFGDGGRRCITPTETWLCERICGNEMEQCGYARRGEQPQARDALDLAVTTLRFAAHQSLRLLRDPVARFKIASFCRGALPRLRPFERARVHLPPCRP